MPPTEDEVLEQFSEIPPFLWDEGDVARNDANRYRDFVIAERHSDGGNVSFSLGEVDLDRDSYDELQNLVRNRVKARIEPLRNGAKQLVKYGEGRDDREYVKYVTVEDFPLLEQIDELFEREDVQATSYHEGVDPHFQAIRVQDHEGEMVVGLQHYWKNQLLGNTSLFNLYYKDEGHEPIDEPIISIPKRLDAVYYDDVLYIFDDWRFEQMFDYHRVYEDVAEDVIESVRDNEIEFENMDMVEDAILSNPIMMRKVDDIQRTGYYEQIDMDDIEWVISEYDIEGVDVIGSADERKVVVGNRQRVWELIHILNDDHVESQLTDTAYQATGKEEI